MFWHNLTKMPKYLYYLRNMNYHSVKTKKYISQAESTTVLIVYDYMQDPHLGQVSVVAW